MKNETSKTVEEGLKSLRIAAEAAKHLTASEAAMRAEHVELLRERRDVFLGNAAEAEVAAEIDRLVDLQSAKFAASHGVQFVRQLGGHCELRTGPKEFREVQPQLPRFRDLAGTLTFDDLCGLAPSLVKSRLREIVETSGAKFGLPKAEREAKLKVLDARIAEMESTHTKLVEDAGAVGIALPLLDSVAKRRAAEAQARDRADQLAADRARGIFTVGGTSVGAVGA